MNKVENKDGLDVVLSSLSRPDALFEPDIFEKMKVCHNQAAAEVMGLSANAHAKVFIEAVVSSFKGYPQMCNLLLDWTLLAGEEPHVLESVGSRCLNDHMSDCEGSLESAGQAAL